MEDRPGSGRRNSSPGGKRGGKPGSAGRPSGNRRGRAGAGAGAGAGEKRRRFPSVQITVTAEDRDLERLVTRHRVVELASSAAGPLTERTLRLLVDRTPDGFKVDVRAHRLLTQQPTPADSLWPEVRDRLSTAARGKPQLFHDDLTPTVLDVALDRFMAQLAPLREFGKLGTVVFQFPSYFTPSPRALDYLAWLRDRCGDAPLAVELRRREWVDTKHREDTLAFLEAHQLAYVCVDAPQGTDTSVPPVAAATTDLAVVRFHGRDLAAWERGVDDPLARFRYEYRRGDLEAWVPRLEKLAAGGRAVHVVMTTAPGDVASRSASLLLKVLTEPPGAKPPPEPPRSGPPRRRRR